MIRLLSGMNAHVALKRLKVAEVSPADLTRVRLLSCVNQHVCAKMGHLEETFKHILQYIHLKRQWFTCKAFPFFPPLT